MITFEEYRKLDAMAMADLVRRKELAAPELLQCASERYADINDSINAITTSMLTCARRYLEQHVPKGPLAGVPMVLKDLLAAFAGVPMSNGSRAYQGMMVTENSTLVQRLADAGAVFVGKSNTPELGLLATTENSAFGPTRNPWNPARTAGGSSGGTAAAVAAGIVPVGSAGDGGGSIRIPASCCGLFGLKPSRGLVPSGPDYGEVWDGAVSEHVITRSVRDSALILDVLAGADNASHCAGTVGRGFLKQLEKPLPKLKIAFSKTSPLGGVVATECQAAVEESARLLAGMGHEVVEAAPDIPTPERIIKAYLDIYLAHVSDDVQKIEDRFGMRYSANYFEPGTLLISRFGRRFRAGDFVASRRYWVELRQAMARFHAQYDVWMTPVLADKPYEIGVLHTSPQEDWAMRLMCWSGAHRLLPLRLFYQFSAPQLHKVPFTQIANLTGQPAMSVPLAWSSDNLPIGIQFVGGVNSDALLLRLARQLEEVQPWFDRLPPGESAS